MLPVFAGAVVLVVMDVFVVLFFFPNPHVFDFTIQIIGLDYFQTRTFLGGLRG